MILTISDFLDKLRQVENEELKKQNITHPPTIGQMYEGLTQSLLEQSLPVSTSLDVVSGFITDKEGQLSDELDCLIVTGEGEDIPYTDKRKYLVDDVVAVIQVKKNLYSKDLRDGYENLLSVLKFQPTRPKNAVLLQDAFQSITRKPYPSVDQVEDLPFEIQWIYHCLRAEFTTPARIIFGYNGFKSHSRFRQSFSDYLAKQSAGGPKIGFDPTSFPTLIVADQFSLVKCNGMPFIAPIDNELFWPFYCSTETNPIEILLQIIWTRLVYDKKLPPSVFDDDVWLSSFCHFLSTKIVQMSGGLHGWVYKSIDASDDALNAPADLKLWEPVYIDNTQFVIMNDLCINEEVDLDDPSLIKFLHDRDYTVETLVESLNKPGLAGRDGNKLVLLTRGCSCAILPTGEFVAGENIGGQLMRWLDIYMHERKNQPPPESEK